MTFDEIVSGFDGEQLPGAREQVPGHLYRIDDLSVQQQRDPDVVRALEDEVVGYVLYREDGPSLPYGPYPGTERRVVKVLFGDGPDDSSFSRLDAQGQPVPMEKEDLPLPILETAARDGYATQEQLEAARTRCDRPELSDLAANEFDDPDEFEPGGPDELAL
jgi:hypothetical protein